VNVKSNADNIVQNVLTDTTLCVENENELFFELVGEEITWSDGTQGQYLYPTNAGTYIVTYEDINTSCLVSDTMEIEIVDCNEDSDTVVVDDVDDVDGVVVEHDVNTEYEVDVDNIKDEVYIEDIKEEINSEEDVDEEYVVEDEYNIEECVVVLPSGFSPNFDGVNDIFRTIIKCEEDLSYYHLTIYDRWGNLVFVSNNPTEGWDGSIHQFNQSNVGVYVYNLSYSFTSSDTMERLNGTLTLIN
jgi:gliding motility-associated-like protein